jgi:hypothetical protein
MTRHSFSNADSLLVYYLARDKSRDEAQNDPADRKPGALRNGAPSGGRLQAWPRSSRFGPRRAGARARPAIQTPCSQGRTSLRRPALMDSMVRTTLAHARVLLSKLRTAPFHGLDMVRIHLQTAPQCPISTVWA